MITHYDSEEEADADFEHQMELRQKVIDKYEEIRENHEELQQLEQDLVDLKEELEEYGG